MGINWGARERVATLASVEERGSRRGCIQVRSLEAEENRPYSVKMTTGISAI